VAWYSRQAREGIEGRSNGYRSRLPAETLYPLNAAVAVPLSPSRTVSRLVVTALLAAIAVYILWEFLPALLWAVVVAVTTWPLYTRVARMLHGGGERAIVAPLAFTLAIGALLLVPLAVIAVELGREALFVAHWVPSIEESGLPLPNWVGELPFLGHYVAHWWQDNLGEPGALTDFLGRVDRGTIIDWTRTLGSQLARRSAVLGFTLLTLFFLYRDGGRLVREVEALLLWVVGPSGRRVGINMLLSVRGTVNGLVLVGLGEGLLLGLAYVVLGLPHPVLLGGITAVLAMIPFGAPVVFCIGAVMLVPQSGMGAALTLLIIGSIVVFVADHFVRPVLIGGAVALPFLWVLLGILGGLESFGLLGLFLGPAVLAALIALWREWVAAAFEPEA
jgi:predicted PurR-regulated permease PerM